MRMACHLKDCMLDYGPFSSCFPYEQYNGILEGISKSWIAPEKQMFLKFWGMQKLNTVSHSNDIFLSLVYEHMHQIEKPASSLGQTLSQDIISMQQVRNISCSVSDIDEVKSPDQCLTPPYYKEKYFRDYKLSYLQEMYIQLPRLQITNISRCYQEYKKCIVNSEEFISCYWSSQRSCAKWCGNADDDEAPFRVGKIGSFVEHDITVRTGVRGSVLSHILVWVQRYTDHPHWDCIHSSVVICSFILDNDSSASFMPISRIMCCCALSFPQSFEFDFGLDWVVIAVPLVNSYDTE